MIYDYDYDAGQHRDIFHHALQVLVLISSLDPTDTYLPRRGAYVERRQDGPAIPIPVPVPVPGQATQPEEGVFDVAESVAANPDTGSSLVIAAAAGGSALLVLATIFLGYWLVKRRERLRRRTGPSPSVPSIYSRTMHYAPADSRVADRSPPSPLPDAPRKARRRSIALSFSTSSSGTITDEQLPITTTTHVYVSEREKIPLTPGFAPHLLSSTAFAVSPLATTFPVPVPFPFPPPDEADTERRATWAEPGYLKHQDPIPYLYTLEPNRFRDSMLSDSATLATPAPLEPNRYRDSMAEAGAEAEAESVATPPRARAKLGLVRILSGNLKRPPPIDVEQARTVRVDVEQSRDSGIRFVNDRGSRVFVPPPYTPR